MSHISLHTADPGGSGASEVSGGSYARRPVEFGAAVAGMLAHPTTIGLPVRAGAGTAVGGPTVAAILLPVRDATATATAAADATAIGGTPAQPGTLIATTSRPTLTATTSRE